MDMTQTQIYSPPPGYFRRLNIIDWLYAIALIAGVLFEVPSIFRPPSDEFYAASFS